jgi:acetate---CoA ligase (ADP-forming) subunit beta
MIEMKECVTLIQKVLKEGRPFMLANEAQQICSFHHIPTPRSYLTLSAKEAALKAKDIGFPVVLKAISPQILHKSDAGAVILNIKDKDELEIEYERLVAEVSKKEPSAKLVGIMIEKMMPPSTEVIVGGLRDSQFGPSIMFGIGGIFTEIYDDVAFRVAPIERMDALNLIRELKGSKIFEGARGRPPADVDAIIDVLIKVSDLMIEHAEVNQLDLNPLIAYSKGVCAVDSRIILNQTEGGK